MHITIQIPITDLRPTADHSAPRIAAPNWVDLKIYENFTRDFGEIEPRQLGVGAVSGDDRYVSARNAIRFADGFGSKPILVGDSELLFESTFRRFFFDGEMAARFELGFTLRRSTQRVIALVGHPIDVSLAIEALLDVKCRVPGVDVDIALRDLGKHLADLWIRSTTPNHRTPKSDYRYWLGRKLISGPLPAETPAGLWAVAGQPVAIVETKPSVPLHVKGQIVKIEEKYGELPEAVYFITPTKQLRIPVWVFGWNNLDPAITKERSKPIRHLRMLLLRTHSDRESLWSVAKYLSHREEQPSKDEIKRFVDLLANRSGVLAPRASVYAKERFGILDWKLCMMAHEIERTATPDFEADLENMKKSFPEDVVAMLEQNEGFRKLKSRLDLVVIENRPDKLGPEIIVLGDAVQSQLVIANQISNSFNDGEPRKTG